MKTRTIRHAGLGFSKGKTSAFDLTANSLLEMQDISSGPSRDAESTRADWQNAGRDIRSAMDAIGCEQ